MLTRLVIPLLLLLAATAAAAPPQNVLWDGSSLAIFWGAGDDDTGLSVDAEGFLKVHDYSQDPNDPGVRLVADNGSFVPNADITFTSLYLGDGDDVFVDSFFNMGAMFFMDLGPGNDFTNVPPGDNTAAFIWGGDGNDDIEGDLNRNAFQFGGPGDDVFNAARGGLSYVDGGIGTNIIAAHPSTVTTYAQWPGSFNAITDSGNSIYLLAPGAGTSKMNVFDQGGDDHLINNGRSFTVNGTTISATGITGQFFGWPNIEHHAPEPATWVLAALGGGLLLWRLRR